jgi:hypothetical protein
MNHADMLNAQRTYDALMPPEYDSDSPDLGTIVLELTMACDDVLETVGKAERAMAEGNHDAAHKLLMSALAAMRNVQVSE